MTIGNATHTWNPTAASVELSGSLTSRRALKQACTDFEAIFIKQMLSSMKKTVEKAGLVDGGLAEDIFEDMLYDEYARVMAKSGSFGVADLLYNQLQHSLPDD